MINQLIEWLNQQKLERGVLRLHEFVENGNVVQVWDLGKNDDVHEWARVIAKCVEADASMTGGKHTYQLQLIVDKEPRARHIIIHEAPPPRTALQVGHAGQPDPATALLEQSYRHIEMLMRSFVTVSLGNTKAQLAEINRLATRNDEGERRIDAMREAYERSVNTDFERELRRKKFDADERRFDEGLSTVRTLFPFMLNSIAKKQLVPTGDNSILREAMRPVMEGITPEQVEKLQQIFTPAQLVGLMEVWRLIAADSKGKTADEKNHEGNPKA